MLSSTDNFMILLFDFERFMIESLPFFNSHCKQSYLIFTPLLCFSSEMNNIVCLGARNFLVFHLHEGWKSLRVNCCGN